MEQLPYFENMRLNTNLTGFPVVFNFVLKLKAQSYIIVGDQLKSQWQNLVSYAGLIVGLPVILPEKSIENNFVDWGQKK
jgi:hypothetical protein